jgi:hypothetical protein
MHQVIARCEQRARSRDIRRDRVKRLIDMNCLDESNRRLEARKQRLIDNRDEKVASLRKAILDVDWDWLRAQFKQGLNEPKENEPGLDGRVWSKKNGWVEGARW